MVLVFTDHIALPGNSQACNCLYLKAVVRTLIQEKRNKPQLKYWEAMPGNGNGKVDLGKGDFREYLSKIVGVCSSEPRGEVFLRKRPLQLSATGKSISCKANEKFARRSCN